MDTIKLQPVIVFALASLVCFALVLPGMVLGAACRMLIESIQSGQFAAENNVLFTWIPEFLKFALTDGFRNGIQGFVAGAFAILITSMGFERAYVFVSAYVVFGVVALFALLTTSIMLYGNGKLEMYSVVSNYQMIGICFGLHVFRNGV